MGQTKILSQFLRGNVVTNAFTDRFNLIEIWTTRRLPNLFSRPISVTDGFSLEIFRGSTHLGSVLSNTVKADIEINKRIERMHIRSGDTIFYVNLGSRLLSIAGSLHTMDGYIRSYDGLFEVKVCDSVAFALSYVQQSDPLYLAKLAIEEGMQRYAERILHDHLDHSSICYHAEHSLDLALLGVAIIRTRQISLMFDPTRAQRPEVRKTQTLQRTEYYSCFISYSSRDQTFAEKLYADLKSNGVRCWFAPEDMKIGDKIRTRIDESISLHQKLLLVLSQHSVNSQWVEQEVEKALAKERKENCTVLFPIRLDQAVMDIEHGWLALVRNTRNIGNFIQWKNNNDYQKSLARLLRDLKVDETKNERE